MATVLLYDSVKVAEFREGLQLFDADDAQQALDRVVTYGFGTSFEAVEGGFRRCSSKQGTSSALRRYCFRQKKGRSLHWRLYHI